MICKKCGYVIEDGAAFCTNCGEKTAPIVNEQVRNESVAEEKSVNAEKINGNLFSEAPEQAQNNNGVYQNGNPPDGFNNGAYYSGGNFNGFNNNQYQNNTQNMGFNPGNAGYPPQGTPYYWQSPVNDKAAELKDYLKWMLLYPLLNFIPGIGFIIYIAFCIKFAIDDTYKARANFFKATLIAQIIGIVIAVLIFVVMFAIMGAATAVGFSFLEGTDPSYFMNEFYDEIYDVLSVVVLK